MALKFEKVISLDFNVKELRLAEGKTGNAKINVAKKNVYPMPEGICYNGKITDIEKMADFVRESIKTSKMSAKKATVVINSDEIQVREISVPSVADAELKSVIEFKSADLFRENVELYVIDFLTIKKFIEEEVEKIRVLIIAIPREIVLKYLSLLDMVGLESYSFDYQPSVISKYLFTQEKNPNGGELKDISIASFDTLGDSASLAISRNGKLEMVKQIEFDLESIVSSVRQLFDYSEEETLEKIFSIEDVSAEITDNSDESRFLNAVQNAINNAFDEARQVIRFYNSRSADNKVEAMFLTGKPFKINGIEKYATDMFEIPSVILPVSDDSMHLYANAIGGLVRMDGGKK